jgi:tetratricopeptide (TPR) repeat protein
LGETRSIVRIVHPAIRWLDTPLKLIGAATALMSLLLGANQFTKVFSEAGERRRHVAELQRVASEQQKSGDYAAAWATLDEAVKAADQGSYLAKLAGRLDEQRIAVRTSQEDLAMAWLRDVRVPGGAKFSDVVDPLAASITRGSVRASGVRKADLLGHLGWAYFLKSRDGVRAGNPEDSYREAIAVDPGNPFAQAHWGHWIIWQRGRVADASSHFAAAVSSGRERAYVRRIQLAAFQLYGSADTDAALLRAVDEMRRNHEPIDASTRQDVFSIYYSAFNSDEQLQRVLGVLPPDEHIAMVRALFSGPDFDQGRAPLRDAMVAMLQEQAGRRDDSLATWRAVRAALPRGGDQRVARRADAAIARLAGRARLVR